MVVAKRNPATCGQGNILLRDEGVADFGVCQIDVPSQIICAPWNSASAALWRYVNQYQVVLVTERLSVGVLALHSLHVSVSQSLRG